MNDLLHDVFLSYSRKDVDMMRRIRTALLNSGLTVWTDEGIKAGTELWINSIETAIEQSNCLLVLLSPDAKASNWVKKELRYANIQDKKIFSLMVRGDSKSSIPFEIIGSQFVDIRTNLEFLSQKLIPDMCDYLGIKSIGQLQVELDYERLLNKQLQSQINHLQKISNSSSKVKSSQIQAKELGERARRKFIDEDYFGALEDYTNAIFLDEKKEYYSEFVFERARVFYELGNLQLAENEFLRSGNNNTFNAPILWELAKISEELGNHKNAISLYKVLSNFHMDQNAHSRLVDLGVEIEEENE